MGRSSGVNSLDGSSALGGEVKNHLNLLPGHMKIFQYLFHRRGLQILEDR